MEEALLQNLNTGFSQNFCDILYAVTGKQISEHPLDHALSYMQ